MNLILLLFFAVFALGIAFTITGICAFIQIRKYYKSLVDFSYYDYDISKDGDD